MSAVFKTIENGSDLLALRDLIEGGLTPVEGAALVPEGYKIESLERFFDHPRRIRGTFHTGQIDQFAGYVAEHGDEDETAVFVDETTLSAVAILDRGRRLSPRWGEHMAVLRLKKSPEWAALEDAARGSFSQASFIDYIHEWADFLSFSSSPLDEEWTPMKILQAVMALRKLKTTIARDAEHVEHDQARNKTVFERAAIDSNPPNLLRFTGRPVTEMDERQVTVRLVYLPQDPPVIKLRLVGYEVLKQAIGSEFRQLVSEQLPTGTPIHLGIFAP